MPIYEFHCLKCEQDSEILVRSSNWDGTECPHCHSTRLEKKLSVFSAANSPEESAPVCTGNPAGCGRCAMPG